MFFMKIFEITFLEIPLRPEIPVTQEGIEMISLLLAFGKRIF